MIAPFLPADVITGKAFESFGLRPKVEEVFSPCKAGGLLSDSGSSI